MILPILDALPRWQGKASPNLTKVFTPEGVRQYDDAFWYEFDAFECHDIDDLSATLREIETQKSWCVIRGELLPERPNRVLRRKDAWGGFPAYFREDPNGVQWFMADFDKIPAPPDLHPDDRLTYLVSLLPDYLWDVSFHYQWSCSAGVYGWDLLSAHLWFMLDEPRTDSSMARWAEATGVIDDAVMRTVQIHYTAAPIFQGVQDPLGSDRCGLVRCRRDTAPVPFVPEPPAPVWNPLGTGMRPAGQGQFWRFEERLAEIGPRLHMPVQRAIASYVGCGGSDWFDLKNRIRSRLMECPKAGQDPETYTNDRYLDASIRGAVRKFGRGRA